jgi:anti-sigma regulatory factor (Ser/Thr protein kinase)
VWKVLKVLDLAELFIQDEDSDRGTEQRVSTDLMGSMEVYEDTFNADMESVGSALERFLDHLKSMAVPIGTQYVLRTLFYEVATNIRLHACKNRQEQITFSAFPDSSRIVLTFVDGGPAFDPTLFDISDYSYRTGSEEGRRSFGITILHKLADRLDYKRLDNSKNVLILERKWRMSQWIKQPSHSAP